MGNILINLWEKVSIYCLNHEEPVEMVIFQNLEKFKTPAYVCSDSGNHCPNRLNLDDYENIVNKFFEYVDKEGPMMDFTNFSFRHRGARQSIYVKIIKYSHKEIKIGIFNETVFGKHYK